MPNPSRLAAGAALLALALAACNHASAPNGAPAPDPVAPDSFTVTMTTTRGPVELMIYRAWAPRGVDRFYGLVKARYYDSVGVFRVVPKFVAQFGLAADPRMTARYQKLAIADDSVRQSNLRGTISFARSGPNSRTTQLFINLVDNARLDASNGFGFPPIGRVTNGMQAVDLFFADYNSQRPSPSQDSISKLGNAYLTRVFPKLDYIVRVRIGKEWKHR